jgi:hypothetical protein
VRPDPITILVCNQARILEAHGVEPAKAWAEAETHVAAVLEELAQAGLADMYLSVALRRARVYRMRCAGQTVRVICERLGVCRALVVRDYRAELDRRRSA